MNNTSWVVYSNYELIVLAYIASFNGARLRVNLPAFLIMMFTLRFNIGSASLRESLFGKPHAVFKWKLALYQFKVFTYCLTISLSCFHMDAHSGESETSAFTVTYMGTKEVYGDRNAYQREVLRLALEKTKQEYGPYRMHSSEMEATRRRSVQILQDNTYLNYVRPLVHEKALKSNKQLAYVEFPIYLGAFSYRVCFVAPAKRQRIEQANTLKALQKFTHVQGTGWIDADILRHNGFSVYENPTFKAIFKVIEINRYDLFCRGINEIRDEINTFSRLYNFELNNSFSLYYPLPTYYYTNAQNTTALKRVAKGLETSFQDGSLAALWESYFRESVEFTKFKQRKVYTLENPFLPSDYSSDNFRYDILRTQMNTE